MRFFVFILSVALFVISCGDKRGETTSIQEIAEDTVSRFFKSHIREGSTIVDEKFSKLYILRPKELPHDELRDTFMKNPGYMAELYMYPVVLSLRGCDPKALKGIIANDEKFEKWNSGSEEYVIIYLVRVKDKYENVLNGGFAVRLDTTLSINRIHDLHQVYKIREMLGY